MFLLRAGHNCQVDNSIVSAVISSIVGTIISSIRRTIYGSIVGTIYLAPSLTRKH